jgi:AcrR family transcriptional regulator
MGVVERREREKQEIREKILDAARKLFVSEGYEGVSMRKVAEAIEYSPTAIYLHFANKEELFMELCHADYQRLAVSFASLAEIADPIERLKKLGYVYIGFGLKNPNHYRMMFMTPHPMPAVTDGELDELGKGNPEEDAYEFLRQTVTEAMKAGAFREDLTDPDIVTQTVWAGSHGVISLQIAKCDDHWVPWRPIEQRAEAMIEGLLKGMLKGGK